MNKNIFGVYSMMNEDFDCVVEVFEVELIDPIKRVVIKALGDWLSTEAGDFNDEPYGEYIQFKLDESQFSSACRILGRDEYNENEIKWEYF